MATGRRIRSWTLRRLAPALGRPRQRLDEPPREVRAQSLFLVLEVHERFRDVQAADDPGPPLDVALLIPLIAQTEVTVRGGDLHRGAELFAVGDAQRHLALAEGLEDLRVEPRTVPKLECRGRVL